MVPRMLKRALLIVAVVLPQVAVAADMSHVRRHHQAYRVKQTVEQNRVVQCTTTDLGLFNFSNCGQGFDPLSIAGN